MEKKGLLLGVLRFLVIDAVLDGLLCCIVSLNVGEFLGHAPVLRSGIGVVEELADEQRGKCYKQKNGSYF